MVSLRHPFFIDKENKKGYNIYMETGIKPVENKNGNKEIEYILEEFDFDKVHKVMTALNWTWARSNNITSSKCEFHVPNHYELIESARERLQNALEQAFKNESGRGFSETGGFRGEAFVEEQNVYLVLSFILESWDNYD